MRKILLAAVALLAVTGMASAATISLSSASVPVGTPSVVLTVSVAGGEAIAGVDVLLLTGGGGVELGGTAIAPKFTGAAIATGPFTGNNGGDQFSLVDLGAGASGQIMSDGVVTTTGTVAATGNIFNISLSLAGLPAGAYPITFLADSTFVGGVPPTGITNGLVTITPEPAAMVLLALGGLFLRRR